MIYVRRGSTSFCIEKEIQSFLLSRRIIDIILIWSRFIRKLRVYFVERAQNMFTLTLCRPIKKRGSSLLNVIRCKIKCHVKRMKRRQGKNCMAVIACKYREISAYPVLIDFCKNIYYFM